MHLSAKPHPRLGLRGPPENTAWIGRRRKHGNMFNRALLMAPIISQYAMLFHECIHLLQANFIPGGDGLRATPVPFPNTEVKTRPPMVPCRNDMGE